MLNIFISKSRNSLKIVSMFAVTLMMIFFYFSERIYGAPISTSYWKYNVLLGFLAGIFIGNIQKHENKSKHYLYAFATLDLLIVLTAIPIFQSYFLLAASGLLATSDFAAIDSLKRNQI